MLDITLPAATFRGAQDTFESECLMSQHPGNIDRRQFLRAAVGACAALSLGGSALAAGTSRPATGMGIVSYSLAIRQSALRREGRDLSDPLTFLRECQQLGAGGMQAPLGIRDADYAASIRDLAARHGLFVEAMIEGLGARLDLDRIERQIRTARACGAEVGRVVVIPGRRYEYFNSAEEFAAADRRALEMLQQVEPLARKHRLRLAVENHKCHRVNERLEMLRKLSSEWIGICVDVGNSFALCEDPLHVVRAYAPWAMTVHIKDQTLREYEDGFLYGDAALGDGFLDLGQMVGILQAAKPTIRFALEVITRDPLKVPVFTPKYWATMPDVRATDLARTMATVKARASAQALPTVSDLDAAGRLAAETANVTRSIDHARKLLRI